MTTALNKFAALWQKVTQPKTHHEEDLSLTLESLLPVSQLYGFETRYLQEKQRHQRG